MNDTAPASLCARPGLPAPSASQRLAYLCTPEARAGWAPEAGPVQHLETHLSWVLRAPRHVLKLKKPVRTRLLDFSTPQARLRNCQEEQRLNARLAPGVVLGVWTLHWDGSGLRLQPQAGHDPRTLVDAAVQMRRLPDACMLDARLRARSLANDAPGRLAVDRLAKVLNAFYCQAAPAPADARTHLARQRRELAIDRAVLAPPGRPPGPPAAPCLPGARRLLDRAETALERAEPALHARVRAGHLVEGHGDLRPEHVCLLRRPLVIDALEFNAALRQLDPLDELVGLGLECERLGAGWIGPRLLACCPDALGGPADPELVALYRLLRALRRARLALAHLLEPRPRHPGRWLPQARSYLRLVAAASA